MNTWVHDTIPPPDADFAAEAAIRQRQLTKPPGSLGRLEELGVRLAAMQRSQQPRLERVRITVFAADHGVAAEGVSAFPQAVTAEMVRNFARGGAAISVLAREQGCELEVVNAGTMTELEPLVGVLDARIAAGTGNIACAPAMDETQLAAALDLGRQAVLRARDSAAQLFIGAEMGIANTTAATAVACALTDLAVETLAGPGTGLDANGVAHKAAVIRRALARSGVREPLAVLRELGGFEIVALTGAYLSSARMGIPVLVDGFIASAAALAAVRINSGLRPWMFFAHLSAEPGHRRLLEELGGRGLVDLGMRLGEGSGAAVALSILRSAAALHGGMATFAEAGVSS
jgi:nicotinate-nucleotide--dimethylbenzimidazole phosphoribosyltransferase